MAISCPCNWEAKMKSSFSCGSPRCSGSVVRNRFLFHYLLPLPYSVLVLVSDKIFSTWNFFYQKFYQIRQRTLKSATWITCWLRSLTIWLAALPESWAMWVGEISRKKGFYQKKEEWRLSSPRQMSFKQCFSCHFEPKSLVRAFGSH